MAEQIRELKDQGILVENTDGYAKHRDFHQCIRMDKAGIYRVKGRGHDQ